METARPNRAVAPLRSNPDVPAREASDTAIGEIDYDAMIRTWQRRAPWFRRVFARFGLQGKLVLCFMLLLSSALGSTCWMFLRQSSSQISDMIGEQAVQISSALALASNSAIRDNNEPELRRIGQDLLRSRNILFVGFLDANNKPVAVASRDPDFTKSDLARLQLDTKSLMQVRSRSSAVFADYVEVVAPILSVSTAATSTPAAATTDPAAVPMIAGTGTQLVGYVAVGVSQTREQAALRQINIVVVGIGAFVTILSLPMAYLLVHRVFFPIRQLVTATNRIASGDLNHLVAIDRPDIIGTLSRSFNEMTRRVKHSQEELEAANTQLEEANEDLEQKIHHRTGQLEMANKRLSSEIAEKEDFLRAVSHDLNAPLRNISGMATMLLMKNRDKFDDDVIHRLERIQKNVEVETDLISELLELSRIKTRRQKMEPVEVAAMMHELGEMFENDLKTKGIQFVIDTPLPVLMGERPRLRQIFQNLIDNAIKYMGDEPGKSKAIHIGCRVRMTEAEFYVSDTGIGIDPEDIDKVFFVFRRGRNTAAQNVAGKGIGLASVKSIIETYSGTIWVESTRGCGTTFRFTINGKHVPATHQGVAAGRTHEAVRA